MFNLKEFIVTNIVNGVKNGTFTKEYANIMAVNYLVKGILTEENIIGIDAQITEWEMNAEKETVEEPTENDDEIITGEETDESVDPEEVVSEEKVIEESDETTTEPEEEPEGSNAE